MKHSHTMRDFFGFAILAILGIAGLWLCRLVFANAFAFVLLFVPTIAAGALLLVGIIGMIWTVVDRLLSVVKARHCTKKI